MKKNPKTIFTCQACGYQTPKWMGKCPDCDQWQTFVEESQAAESVPGLIRKKSGKAQDPVPIDAVELADELLISVNTLRSHMKNIYAKLGVHSRHEAVVKASQLGLL